MLAWSVYLPSSNILLINFIQGQYTETNKTGRRPDNREGIPAAPRCHVPVSVLLRGTRYVRSTSRCGVLACCTHRDACTSKESVNSIDQHHVQSIRSLGVGRVPVSNAWMYFPSVLARDVSMFFSVGAYKNSRIFFYMIIMQNNHLLSSRVTNLT